MIPLRILRSAALLLTLASTVPASAAAPQIEVQARAHFDRGQKLSSEQRYLEALAEFSAGYELSQKPLFLFNMAECARLSGDRGRALTSYERYLAADPGGKLAGTARQRVGELRGSEPAPGGNQHLTPGTCVLRRSGGAIRLSVDQIPPPNL